MVATGVPVPSSLVNHPRNSYASASEVAAVAPTGVPVAASTSSDTVALAFPSGFWATVPGTASPILTAS